jgi:hypothetical protein
MVLLAELTRALLQKVPRDPHYLISTVTEIVTGHAVNRFITATGSCLGVRVLISFFPLRFRSASPTVYNRGELEAGGAVNKIGLH